MILSKIAFKNYRCFPEGEIEFQSDKPINLFLGINGSGKTELLYAIWYALHGFDFSSLALKEDTPYSLNSKMYQELQTDPTKYRDYSEVILTFDHNNNGSKKTYVLSRKETYEKSKANSTGQETSLFTYNEFGEKSTLITDQQRIADIIEHIIPEKVLKGVMFDGERMRNLSSTDENSVKAIEGTIEDVTNLKLFTSLTNDLKSLNRTYNNEIRKIGRRSSHAELEELSDLIMTHQTNYEEKMKLQEVLKTELPKLERKINNLSAELKDFSEAKVFESERVGFKRQTDRIEKELEKTKNSLQDKEFKNISIPLTNNLLSEVNELIVSNKLPKGLTSNAVENILKKQDCICGRPHDENTRKEMAELIRKLPPENLNAVINEWVRDFESLAKFKTSEIDEVFDSIKEKEREISNNKIEINKLSAKITNIDNADLIAKESEKKEVETKYVQQKQSLNRINKELTYLNSEINKLSRKRDDLAKSDSKTKVISKKLDFVKKAEKLVDKLKEIRMVSALNEINKYMNDAYAEISEDYPRGRRVYITQYVNEKYKLVSYYKNELAIAEKSVELGLLRNKYKELDLDNPAHLKEAYILDAATSSSTGQSKIMTLSFVKAILDFSSKGKKDEFSVKRQYPLVLDAPFSEISGENLIKSAANLHKFNEQIILISDPNSFKPLEEYMNEDIGRTYYFDKNDGESSTTIRKG